MCFPTSKLPHGTNSTGTPKGYPQGEVQEIQKAIEQVTRNPLSVGKHRNRAKTIFSK